MASFPLFYRLTSLSLSLSSSLRAKRYLNDWRERACLDVADLNLLFGNIEQVCDFNMILLDELKSSGMEPSGISNCFIKLQNQFDAYTQYW